MSISKHHWVCFVGDGVHVLLLLLLLIGHTYICCYIEKEIVREREKESEREKERLGETRCGGAFC